MTPEETKWRASVYAPEKIRRKLKSTTGGSWPGKSCFRVGGDNKRKRRKNAKKYGNHKKRSYVIHLYTHHCRRDPFV